MHYKEPTAIERFHVLSEIGSGCFARVFKARYTWSSTIVALKVLHDTSHLPLAGKSVDGPVEATRNKEILIMKSLVHENIVQLHDHFTHKNKLHLVLEYCQGGDLKRLLQSVVYLKEHVVLHCLEQISSAMSFLSHNSLIHRDLKPANILLASPYRANCKLYLKVADFGLARYLEGDAMAATMCGTPLYMSPEMMECRSGYTSSIDVYSCGCIMHEMLFGVPPFLADSPASVLALSQERNRMQRAMTTPLLAPLPTSTTASVAIKGGKHKQIQHQQLREETVLLLNGMIVYDYAARPSFQEVHQRLALLVSKVAIATERETEERRGEVSAEKGARGRGRRATRALEQRQQQQRPSPGVGALPLAIGTTPFPREPHKKTSYTTHCHSPLAARAAVAAGPVVSGSSSRLSSPSSLSSIGSVPNVRRGGMFHSFSYVDIAQSLLYHASLHRLSTDPASPSLPRRRSSSGSQCSQRRAVGSPNGARAKASRDRSDSNLSTGSAASRQSAPPPAAATTATATSGQGKREVPLPSGPSVVSALLSLVLCSRSLLRQSKHLGPRVHSIRAVADSLVADVLLQRHVQHVQWQERLQEKQESPRRISKHTLSFTKQHKQQLQRAAALYTHALRAVQVLLRQVLTLQTGANAAFSAAVASPNRNISGATIEHCAVYHCEIVQRGLPKVKKGLLAAYDDLLASLRSLYYLLLRYEYKADLLVPDTVVTLREMAYIVAHNAGALACRISVQAAQSSLGGGGRGRRGSRESTKPLSVFAPSPDVTEHVEEEVVEEEEAAHLYSLSRVLLQVVDATGDDDHPYHEEIALMDRALSILGSNCLPPQLA